MNRLIAAGVLYLAGNQFAHRHGQIQAPIADDAREVGAAALAYSVSIAH
jgi:hypothetical protein